MKRYDVILFFCFLGLVVSSGCGAIATEPPPVPVIATEVVIVPIVTEAPPPTPTSDVSRYVESLSNEDNLSTDWHVCGFVVDKGVVGTLSDLAGNSAHELGGPVGQVIEVVHMENQVSITDDWLELYDWTSLLSANPVVYPGDYVCDTIYPRMQQYFTVSPENDYRSK